MEFEIGFSHFWLPFFFKTSLMALILVNTFCLTLFIARLNFKIQNCIIIFKLANNIHSSHNPNTSKGKQDRVLRALKWVYS
jgi:hypothetical protein